MIWLFDLDNTLHQADFGIFDLINREMTAYLMQHLSLPEKEASDLRQKYWNLYGATLAGLEKHHPQIDINDFLRASHPEEEVRRLLVAETHLPQNLMRIKGRKAIFSNGPSFYVQNVAQSLSIQHLFTDLFGCDRFDFLYKPHEKSYSSVCRQMKVLPEDCIMVDDNAENLRTAKKSGMKTILFGHSDSDLPFIDDTAENMQNLADKYGDKIL